jgi:hypothetical protein
MMAGKNNTCLKYQELNKKILRGTKWTYHTMAQIDWDSVEITFTKVSKPARIKFSKLIFDLNQTNYRNNKFYGTTRMCLSCNKHKETFQHIAECQSPL